MKSGVENLSIVGRDKYIASEVLFLDGISGTGKTMMGPILATFDRVEIQKLEHIYEYVCALRVLDRIEEDAAEMLIGMYLDLTCYNLSISRETNFRWKDLSGVLANPRSWRYFKRLLERDGAAAVERIQKARPIVQIVSHQVLGIAAPLFRTLGDRLKVIEMVRHPLNLVEHWASFMDWVGREPRDFTVWIRHGDDHLPWYALGWEENFRSSNAMDRAIHCLYWLNERMNRTLSSLTEKQRKQVLIIPFEHFVRVPDPFISQIGTLLNTGVTPSTRGELRRQKVPREITTDGPDLEIYRRYNWEPPDKSNSEQAQLKKRWEAAKRQASKEGMEILEQLCSQYEQRYLK
jgi:hypothetical protein